MPIWKDVSGFEGIYEVSDRGELRRHLNFSPSRYTKLLPGCPVRQRRDTKGYMLVHLASSDPYCEKNFLVHVLVALTYIGPVPSGMAVNHKNGDKSDNSLGNLEYVTPSENIIHAKRSGLWNSYGERHPRAKLTEGDVRDIRQSSPVVADSVVAKKYGVTQATISSVISRRTWAHVL